MFVDPCIFQETKLDSEVPHVGGGMGGGGGGGGMRLGGREQGGWER